MVRTEKRYYESGALRMRATFDDDLMEGPEEEYFENGQLQVRRVYSRGRVVDSVVVAMNDDGSLSETEESHQKITSPFFDASDTA